MSEFENAEPEYEYIAWWVPHGEWEPGDQLSPENATRVYMLSSPAMTQALVLQGYAPCHLTPAQAQVAENGGVFSCQVDGVTYPAHSLLEVEPGSDPLYQFVTTELQRIAREAKRGTQSN